MISESTPGQRLKAYIEARWGRAHGGMEGLAQAARLRGRQTLYEWFAGGEPSLASLQQVADALEVRRVDLVAAYDGVTAPEQQETPRPEWAEGLEERVAGAVLSGLASPDRLRAALYAIESLDTPEEPPDESRASDASAQDPAAGAPPAQRRGRSRGRGSADRDVT